MQIDKTRLGWFFVLIGLVFLVIFFTTDQADNPDLVLFFLGAAALFLGGGLVWSNRKTDVEEVRFRTLRHIRQKSKERKARKENE